MQSPRASVSGASEVPGSVMRAVRKLCGKHTNQGRLDVAGAEKVFAAAGYGPTAAANGAAARMFQSATVGQSGTMSLAQVAAYLKHEPGLNHRVKELMDNDSELAECEKGLRPVFCKHILGDGRLDVAALEQLLADPALPVSTGARNHARAHVPELMSALDTQKRGSLSLSDVAEFVIDPDKFAGQKPAAAVSPKITPKAAASAASSHTPKQKRKFQLAMESGEPKPLQPLQPHQQTPPAPSAAAGAAATPSPTAAAAPAEPTPGSVTAHLLSVLSHASGSAYHKIVSPVTHRLIPQGGGAPAAASTPPEVGHGAKSTSAEPQSEPAVAPLPIPPFQITPQQVQPPSTLVPTPSPTVPPTVHTHEAIDAPSFAPIHDLRFAEYQPEARVHLPPSDPQTGEQPKASQIAGGESELQLPRLSREAVPAPSPSPSASPAVGVLEARPDAQKQEVLPCATPCATPQHTPSAGAREEQCEPPQPPSHEPAAPHAPPASVKSGGGSGRGTPHVKVQAPLNVCGSAAKPPPPTSVSGSATNAPPDKSFGGSMGRMIERGAAMVYNALGGTSGQSPSAAVAQTKPSSTPSAPQSPHNR